MVTNEAPASFAELLTELGGGDAHRDLHADLKELVRAIHEQAIGIDGPTKIKGTMKIAIKVAIDARGNVGVDIDHSITKPKKRRPTAQAWIDRNGNLVTEHPRQTTFPKGLIDVSARRAGDVQEVADDRRPPVEV